MIQIADLHKTFGPLTVLDGLNLQINKGGIYAILGPNGSGKTTLIKSILGMVVPEKGNITYNNQHIIGKWEYRNDINYLPQIANFPGNLTVNELIKMICDLRPKKASPDHLIQTFGLLSHLSKKLSNLSGGTKQKVNIVLTFMFDSELIILDEPSTGLDPNSLIQLKSIIKEEKKKQKTILVTTHILSLVEELADEIIFLMDGKIYFKGTLARLKEQTLQNNLESAIATLTADKDV